MPCFFHAEMPAVADYDMIEYCYPHDISGINKFLRDFNIFSTRRRISRRVIVCHDYVCSRMGQRFLEYFTVMGQGILGSPPALAANGIKLV